MVRLVVLAALLGACTGEVGGIAMGGGSDDPTPDAAAPEPGATSVSRGMQWVAAKVPYCQAPNHHQDNDTACSSTCTRPDVPEWDAYRSDCSGFVSWSWALPAPGRTTHDFAPFKSDITHAIDAMSLRSGDAVNNMTHMMLFEAWVMPGVQAKFLEETGCSSSTPYAVEITANVTISGQTITVQNHATYTAIRYDQAP